MELNIDDKTKTVSIWLTNDEKANAELKERLKTLYIKYKEQKYHVAVFESGSKELYGSTFDLLAYNKRRIAELETQREKLAASQEKPSVREQLRAIASNAKPAPHRAKQQEYSR